MKLKFLWILALVMTFGLQFSYAQEKTISGQVTDQNGLPLPGASVAVKGTTTGTQTDFDGNYSLSANVGQVLVYSYIGQKSQERKIGALSVINVQLEEDAQALEEVVVVGFGEKTRKQLTTSISSVAVDEIKTIATPTVTGALQGSVTGLQVNQNSGSPGGGFSVRVRGASTINGSNEPLYVVDGVPLITGSLGGGTFGGQSNDALATLNFADVANIEVLKDASATAIYGSQAANGVVLITTKRGQAGKMNVEINSYIGMQEALNRWDLAPLGESLKYADIAFDPVFGAPAGSGLFSQGFVLGYNFLDATGLSTLDELYAYDVEETYVDAIYRNSPIVTSTDVSLSGGTDKARYFLQMSDFQQEGAILNQDFGRRSMRLNADFKASDAVSLDAGVTITESRTSRTNGDNNIYSGLSTSLLEYQGIPLRDEFGNLTRANFTFSNPLQNVLEENSNEINLRILANTGLNINLSKAFTFNTRFSLERMDFRQDRFFPATSAQGAGANGDAFTYINLYTNYVNNTTLNYNNTFGDWSLNALAGFSFQGTDVNQSTMNTQNFPTGFNQTANGSEVLVADNFNTERKLFSYLSRVGLSFRDKLFLEGSIRADASSVFGSGNQIGYFPAFSAAYIVSDEAWFKNDVLTNLKMRGSWGQTGNQSGLGNFASRGLIGAVNIAGVPGTTITQLENPNLKWEVTTQTNFGADVQLFKFLNVTYDYYIKDTDDLLLSRSLRNSTGFISVIDNVGSIKNTGHEIGISANIFNQPSFSWNSQVNLSFNKNEVTGLVKDSNGEYIPIDDGFASRIAVGQPLGSFYGLIFDGIYGPDDIIPNALQNRGVSAGDVRYIDTNGDGDITPDDRQFMGNPNPGLIGNFRNSIRIGNFDLSGNFQFELDKDMFNQTLAFGGPGSNPIFGKLRSAISDYYTADNTDATQPRPRYGGLQSYNSQNSTQYIEEGDYIRLKEVVLGYTFKPRIWNTDTSIRVYAGGDNLITITDYSGLDPEVNAFGANNTARGTDFLTQGLNKVYKFGLNIKF